MQDLNNVPSMNNFTGTLNVVWDSFDCSCQERINGALGGCHALVPFLSCPIDYKENFSNWEASLNAIANDTDVRKDFLEKLTSDQVASLKVLEEWWGNCDTPRQEWVRRGARSSDILQHPPKSTYELRLLSLWNLEYGRYVSSRFRNFPQDHNELERSRRWAIESTAAHRLATIAYKDMEAELLHGSLSAKAPLYITEKPPIGSLLPYPWLRDVDTSNQYPHYLWDRTENRTVHLGEERPEYSAISHTWGRFRSKDKDVHLAGVPWRIPCLDQTILFDVARLPDILARCPVYTRYLWFDLLCIPQDGSVEQDIEIGKQAGIFGGAKLSLAWFNQLSDWTGMRSAIDWMALRYLENLSNEDTMKNIGEMLPAAVRKARGPSMVVISPTTGVAATVGLTFKGQDDVTVEPDGWFTSLWTLQEICLRPDMLLCDRNWNVLGSGRQMIPFPMDHIVSLFNVTIETIKRRTSHDSIPQSVQELSGVLMTTAMHKLTDLSPLDILVFGSKRFCANADRARGIMSALGVTDWYNQALQRGEDPGKLNPATLVQGIYPIEFVRECHAKFGGIVFSVVDFTRLDTSFYKFNLLRTKLVNCTLTGTMLPFISDIRQRRYAPTPYLGVRDNEAVKEWIIDSDGSVTMSKASILASCSRAASRNNDKLEASIYARTAPKLVMGKYILHDWLQSFRPRAEKHAVCLFEQSGVVCCGVILEKIYLSSEPVFIKLGIFKIETDRGFVFPPTQTVRWKVI